MLCTLSKTDRCAPCDGKESLRLSLSSFIILTSCQYRSWLEKNQLISWLQLRTTLKQTVERQQRKARKWSVYIRMQTRQCRSEKKNKQKRTKELATVKKTSKTSNREASQMRSKTWRNQAKEARTAVSIETVVFHSVSSGKMSDSMAVEMHFGSLRNGSA